MIRYECDKCGATLHANDSRRYIVKIEVYAAATHIDTSDEQLTSQESLEDILAELRDADADDVEDQTYRALRFDLCDRCRRVLLHDPLGKQPPT